MKLLFTSIDRRGGLISPFKFSLGNGFYINFVSKGFIKETPAMKTGTQQNEFLELEYSRVETGVIRTLLYFDIFHYPLTLEELIKFHPQEHQEQDITHAISYLRNKLVVFQYDNFYSLNPDQAIIQRRKAGNELARKSLQTAKKFSWIISKFPFTRSIMLSGSLSKDYMDRKSDIDFFIITEPGRLWLTRGLLALFKRLVLINSHGFLCFNYFIDMKSLEIEEKNLYTAMETTTLIPVYGRDLYGEFISKNNWTKLHLPNVARHRTAFISENPSYLKRFLERLLSGSFGEKLDQFFMKVFMQQWNKKYRKDFSPEEFQVAFESKRHVSKSHSRFCQKRVLQVFQEKIERFELMNDTKLSV
jgi:hypothetical protein